MEMLRERKTDRVLVLKLRFILKVFRKISIGGKHEKIWRKNVFNVFVTIIAF